MGCSEKKSVLMLQYSWACCGKRYTWQVYGLMGNLLYMWLP